MRKRNMILLVLSALLLCFGLVQKQGNAAPADSNLEYMSLAREPDYCRISFDVFEPTLSPWREEGETRHLTDPQALKRVVDDALGRMGEMIAPYPDCENCHAYSLLLEKMTEPHTTGVRLYFLVEDDVFKPVVYAEFAYTNRVWYTFDDPEEFIETYWNLAPPPENE